MDTFLQRLRSVAGGGPAPVEAPTPELLTLLQTEHREIRQLFELYEDLLTEGATPAERQDLAARLCLALALHAVVEEDVVYPAVRRAPGGQRLVAEAEVEHGAARALIDELALLEPDDPLFDAHVRVLGAYVRHHLDEEEAQLLPVLAGLDADLPGLTAQARARRQLLEHELEALDDEDA